MPRDSTQYTIVADEPSLNDELRELDWANGHQPPVQEAAALVYEMLTNPEAGDERGLYELLAEVPSTFRNEVLTAVLSENMPAQERGTTDAVPEPVPADNATNYSPPQSETDQQAPQHPAEASLQDDLERTQHILQYVEAIGDPNIAYQLGKVIEDSRNLELRQLSGDPATYGNDPHEKYVQCIIDIPATLEAKQAMALAQWNEAQLHEAAQHEVNRMAYRLNLEIQDRLITQFDNRKLLAYMAKQAGMDDEIVKSLTQLGNEFADYAIGCENSESPTYRNITQQVGMFK